MNAPNDLSDWLALLQAPQVGASTARRLADHFSGPQAALAASERELRIAGLSERARQVIRNPDWKSVDAALQWLNGAANRHALTLGSTHYPPLLRSISDAPPVLFVCGDPGLLAAQHLAIVGSRNATIAGQRCAQDFAAELSRAGFGIVSGLAAGIDTAAHKGALHAGGITIAVAAHGLDQIYPRSNRELATQIVERGALISEFVPGTKPLREHFPRRNRIISGLSLGVLVVEAALRSGSLITARLGAEQGREVFAVPGSIHNPMVRGCHTLLRQGAKLVETVSDVIEELGDGMQTLDLFPEAVEPLRQEAVQVGDLDDDYVTLLNAMGYDPVSVDELVGHTGLTPQSLSSMLLTLELRGIVQPVSGIGYVRAAG